MTAADLLIRRLRDYGVRHVFGYPGGQLTPLYDALAREPAIRHVLARDEQAAGFMADGYARATGKTGVCLAVCGPGVLNAATPVACSFTDSVPVLLLSGQIPQAGRGLRSGYYHENEQLEACASFTKWRACLDDVHSIRPQVDLAMAALTGSRPGPVLLEIPLDVLRAKPEHLSFPSQPTMVSAPVVRRGEIESLANLVQEWQKPLILAGGGVVTSGAESVLIQVAERLGAPVFHTLMGKGVIPADHPLAAGLPWFQATSDLTDMESLISPLFAQADGLLAIGCRFSQISTANWKLPMPRALVHIDVDRSEIGRHVPRDVGDFFQLRRRVKIEPVRHPEARAQRRADHAGARGRADERELRQVQPHTARVRPLVDDDVELVILHRGVEVFLDRGLEPVDFVDEKHVAAFERREQAGEVAGFFYHRPAGVPDVHAHRVGDDVGEARFPEARRPAEQNVFEHVAAPVCGLHHQFEPLADFFLAGEFVEVRRPQRNIERRVRRLDGLGDEILRHATIEPRNAEEVEIKKWKVKVDASHNIREGRLRDSSTPLRPLGRASLRSE